MHISVTANAVLTQIYLHGRGLYNYDTNSEHKNSKHKLANYNLLASHKIIEQMSYLFSKKKLIIPESFFLFPSLFCLLSYAYSLSLDWLTALVCHPAVRLLSCLKLN